MSALRATPDFQKETSNGLNSLNNGLNSLNNGLNKPE